MKELTFGQLYALLRRHAILILAIVVAFTLLVAVYFYRFRRDVYTAEAVLYVLDKYTDTSENTRYDTSVSAQLAADYKVLLRKKPLQDLCAQALGAASLDDLLIDIYSESGTRVLTLSVTGADPEYCARAANAIAATFVEYIRTLTHADGLSVALEAQPPTEPSGPHRLAYTALAMIGSLFLGACLVTVIGLTDRRLRTEEDLSVLKLPVLARVRGYAGEMRAFLSAGRRDGATLLGEMPVSVQESVKALSANVVFAGGANPPGTLMITSTVSNEGKSSIAVMLASAVAAERRRVLLVDLDFRNPSVGRLLRARGKYDLLDHLRGERPLEAVIRKLENPGLSFIDNLHDDVSAGNAIRSAAFDRFLARAREQFDLVIFDVPPVGLFIDAAVLAPKLDATILVVGSGLPSRKGALRAVDQLNKARAGLIGVVHNFARDERANRTYYSRYYGSAQSGTGRRRIP